MPARFRLTPLEGTDHAALVARYNQTDNPEERTRCQMVLLAHDQQLAPAAIAPLVQRSHDTVLRVLQRFEQTGLAGLAARSARIGRPRVTAPWQAELARVIDLDPRTVDVASANWTTDLLATYLGRVTGLVVSEETVRRHLHGLGYVCKRPTWTVAHKAQEQSDWVGNACGWRCS
jgi:transposase